MMLSGGSLGTTSSYLHQRRPSFPQSGSGDWSLSRRHNNGKPAPTAASMAEMADEDEDLDTPTTATPSPLSLQHAPHCRCYGHNALLAVPGQSPSSPTSGELSVQGGPALPGGRANSVVWSGVADSGGGGGGGGGGGHANHGGGGVVGNGGGGDRLDGPPICTCQLSYVTLGGVTSPDGSRTSLSSALTNNNKKPRRARGAKLTVIFNVGGQRFETYRSTLKRFKNSFFADDDKLRTYFRPAHGDYFFDRDPTAFGCVLNYLRTGDLHVPTTMCGPALQTELEFWGIEELDIERCCWTQYNTWKTQSRSLEKLEYDRKFSTTQNLEMLRQKSASCWGRHRAAVWQFLQDPGSSRAAKAYAWVSIIFVFISIFSFCADTHPIFRVKADDVGQFASVYRFFNLESVDMGSVNSNNDADTTTSGSYNDSLLVTSSAPAASMLSVDNETSVLDGGSDGGNVSVMGRGKEEDLPHPSLLIMDLCCLIFFTLEYITRFVCSPSKVNFLRSFQNVIDFVAISPDYVELLFLIFDPMSREGMAVMDLMFILRMLRLCRIFRLIRHVPGLWILLYTLKASFNELMLMFVFLLIGMVVFATLMHFAEAEHEFANIPVGFWWSVVTMTTVGYGDMYPRTAAGYVIGSCCAVAGLLMIAFTVPIIVSNFVLYYTHVQYGLARRDRELERMEEEGANPGGTGGGGGGGDEENPLVNDVSGSRPDVSADGKAVPAFTHAPLPLKPHVDSAAIARGENIALTSACSDNPTDSVKVVDESPNARTAVREGVFL